MIDIPDSILPKDNDGNFLCPKCRQIANKCICIITNNQKDENRASVSVQKCSKGKVITIITQLRPDIEFLKMITKDLKTKLGTGGSFEIIGQEGKITLQGKKIHELQKLLTHHNINIIFK